jgi:hypothetical protein
VTSIPENHRPSLGFKPATIFFAARGIEISSGSGLNLLKEAITESQLTALPNDSHGRLLCCLSISLLSQPLNIGSSIDRFQPCAETFNCPIRLLKPHPIIFHMHWVGCHPVDIPKGKAKRRTDCGGCPRRRTLMTPEAIQHS